MLVWHDRKQPSRASIKRDARLERQLDPRWDELYGELRTTLYRTAALIAGDAEAEECVQDAFERAMRETHFFEEVRDPAAWLRTVVSRRAVSRVRRRALFGALMPRLHEPATDYDTDVLDLRRSLQGLPGPQRAAIVLRYYGDADYDEIARALGVAPSSVGPLLTRARTRLREALGWRTTTAS